MLVEKTKYVGNKTKKCWGVDKNVGGTRQNMLGGEDRKCWEQDKKMLGRR